MGADDYEAIARQYGDQVTMNDRGDLWITGTSGGLTANLVAAGIADFERRLRGEVRDS